MTGWQRLFVVLFVIVGTLMALLFGTEYPDRTDSNFVWACDGLTQREVSSDRAKEYLRTGIIPAADTYSYPSQYQRIAGECARELQHVANGTLLSSKRAEWRGQVTEAFGWFAFAAGLVYLLGMAIGWVWRGFFPKKPEAGR